MRTLEDWLTSGEYLPGFMRDNHDQKNLFKRIDQMVCNAKRKRPNDYLSRDLPNWIAAHIYVIDFFLWYMAQYGYTLQKSRSRFEFGDIKADIKAFKDAEFKAFADELRKEHNNGSLGKL